jgi:transposase InsO family protein
MPWSETTKMRQRMRFVLDAEEELFTMTELCQRYGISRVTGHKWLERFRGHGVEGLEDLSRAPHHSPHQTPAAIVEMLAEARRCHPNWGARKLIRWLERRRPHLALPAPSTACDILKRLGLIKLRRHRRHLPQTGRGLTEALAPNQVWTADFKGQFRTRDGRYCYPLTVADRFSRYLLGCRSQLSVETIPTRKNFQRLFRQYGLPQIIRTDNGVPFAAPTAISRLSRLSVWWIRLGIRPELIQPSHPEQNGRHERMHRTLKAETTRPPAQNARAQQRRFDSFRREFNHERPHETLQDKLPADLYQASPRPFPDRLPQPQYPGHFEVRKVSKNGGIRWKKGWVNISHSLLEQFVGLEEVDDGVWSLYFGPLQLGRFHENDLSLSGARLD